MADDVRLMLGDCVDRMAELPGESVDLILTSPPYDNLRAYAAGSAFDFEATADQCRRVLRPGGVIVWVVGDQTVDGSETGTSFRQALHFKAIGLNLHDTMIFEKLNPMPLNHNRYEQVFEFMFVFSRGRPRTVNKLTEPCRMAGKMSALGFQRHDLNLLTPKHGNGKPYKDSKPRGNIWSYGVACFRAVGHPAPFPPQLAVDHIRSWTNPGDTVLDPFAGSGTTLEACFNTDRRGIGIDISPEYLTIAGRRIAAARAAMPLFAGLDSIDIRPESLAVAGRRIAAARAETPLFPGP